MSNSTYSAAEMHEDERNQIRSSVDIAIDGQKIRQHFKEFDNLKDAVLKLLEECERSLLNSLKNK